MATTKKGADIQEYPKLIRVKGAKVRVMNKEEEAKYTQKSEVKKDAAWGKNKDK